MGEANTKVCMCHLMVVVQVGLWTLGYYTFHEVRMGFLLGVGPISRRVCLHSAVCACWHPSYSIYFLLLCVCVCVCVRARACACMCTCVCVHVHVYLCESVHVFIFVC